MSVPEIGALRCLSCGGPDHEGPCNPRSYRQPVQVDTSEEVHERARREEELRQHEEYVAQERKRRELAWARAHGNIPRLTTQELEWYAQNDHAALELQLQDRWEPPQVTAEIKEIETRVRAMIDLGRRNGANFAADNLEEWLNGTYANGRMKFVDKAKIRSHSAITRAEQTSREQLADRVMAKVRDLVASGELPDGGEIVLDSARFRETVEDRVVVMPVPVLSELYYASNLSTISYRAELTVRRSGMTFEISGRVSHFWSDKYDWNEGDWFVIPTVGLVLSSELRMLEVYRQARAYEMRSNWNTWMSGQFSLDETASEPDQLFWTDTD